jgi:hypothetical protein
VFFTGVYTVSLWIVVSSQWALMTYLNVPQAL